ncbi:SPFH domain-containing protein [Geomonas sp. Red32]|uniref:SPFH domain-containing protein n=1 Tax=Geomonas sp. Red32 TaxID=2912856 RepID=UPI00202CA912|nr:SPFH domain-containing protein [Geomonas sp. Red32]MCM0083193.1 SPFH domain-containing protein [Geomonas sp. Red32]
MIVATPVVLFIIIAILAASIRILREYERGVVFRLGRLVGVRGPGLILLIPALEQMITVSLRTVATEIPAQDVVTRDNVTIRVTAVVYAKVVEPQKAIVEVENYQYALNQLAQTALRAVIGQHILDEVLGEQTKLQEALGSTLASQTGKWGVKIDHVEMKNIDLPEGMQRAMAKEAEAERERRAKIIHASGELEASVKLAEAAAKLAETPSALHLRTLQTMTEISAEKNSTILFPYELINVAKELVVRKS